MEDQKQRKIERELARLGMAPTNEAGWYVTIVVDGVVMKVWATDAVGGGV